MSLFDERALELIVRRAVQAAIDEKLGASDRTGNGPILVSAANAADLLDVSRQTVHDLIAEGELQTVEGIGRGVKVTVASLHAYVARHTSQAVA